MAAGPAAPVHILTATGRGQRIRDFLAGPGAAAAPWLSTMEYRTARRADALPSGAYLFADLDRLEIDPAFQAGRLHRRLAAQAGVRCLNDPTRSRRRFELMRLLHARGLNPIEVWRAEDRRLPPRWPVFVRAESTPLERRGEAIRTPDALFAAIGGLDRQGAFRPDLLLVEAREDLPGPEQAVGVLRIGDALIAEVPPGGPDPMAEAVVRDRVRAVFDLARIAYGRLSVVSAGGQLVIWDVDTHPHLARSPDPAVVVRALAAVAGPG